MSNKFKIRATKATDWWEVGDVFETFLDASNRVLFIDNFGDVQFLNSVIGYFEPATEAPSYQSPVKERVVKEIAEGKFHNICVEYSRDGKNDLRVYSSLFVNPTAEDLRHAARVFNDLAAWRWRGRNEKTLFSQTK